MASFPQDHLKKSHKGKYTYDAAQVVKDLAAMADAAASGEIVLITRRVSDPVNEASDGSGRKSSYAFLEWAHK